MGGWKESMIPVMFMKYCKTNTFITKGNFNIRKMSKWVLYMLYTQTFQHLLLSTKGNQEDKDSLEYLRFHVEVEVRNWS